MKALAFAVARLLNALYFVASFAYCLLSYSAFAYEQFIRPQLIGWLPELVARHHLWFWLTVLVTTPTLAPALNRGTRRGRTAVALYLGFNVALGLWLLVNPVMVLIAPGVRTLLVGILWLIPPLALAVVDHLTTTPPSPERVDEPRVFLGVATASVLIWLSYVLLIPWYASRASGADLPAAALVLAVVISLVSHLLLFALVSLIVLAGVAATGLVRHRYAEYWMLAALWVSGLAFLLNRVVAAALSFQRIESWVLSVWLSAVLVAIWSGLSWQRASARPHDAEHASAERGNDALDIWFGPITGHVRAVAIAGVIGLPLLALVLRAAVAQFDWNFLLQKLGVCLVWALALGWTYTAVGRGRGRARPAVGSGVYGLIAVAMVVSGLAGVPVAARVAAWSGDARLAPEFVLDRYAAHDASYQMIRDLLRTNSGEAAAFYTYLKAHSTLGSVAVDPVDVRFVDRFEARQPPHIFLFVVDSLRRDYLSPYNTKVTFTPATQAFAGESVVFERAFSRYGATGLSVPALWTGGMLLHKQYVKPFAPMNALEKLLDGAAYRRYLSDDHLVTQLFRPSPATVLLDQGLHEMDHTLCATLEELVSRLDDTRGDPRPIFAMTRPLQLHMARLVRDPATAAAAYPGFSAGYAAQVASLDRCFGEFVGYLKRTALYDRSVVVLTSDHGESLGEDGRWGHAYTLYPEVVQIPLLVHLPASSAATLTVDRSRVALSTDITPTLYALAGQRPRDLGDLYGESLFTFIGQPIETRRRESFLLSSSYGPVYAMLRHNGRALYIADAVQGRDFAYEMQPDGRMDRLTITESMRTLNQRLIRDQIAQIAAEYRFAPTP